MEAETTYRITVSEKDTEVLGELIAILDGCPVELSNDDYVEIIRAIGTGSKDVEAEAIELSFTEGSEERVRLIWVKSSAKNTAVYALRASIDIHRLRSVKPVAFAATRICRSIHSSTIRRHTEEYQNARVIPGRRRQSR